MKQNTQILLILGLVFTTISQLILHFYGNNDLLNGVSFGIGLGLIGLSVSRIRLAKLTIQNKK